MTQPPGPTEVICTQVRKYRQQYSWSARELADRCRAAGLAKWNREVVANIENGRRSQISVEELFVLAIVLGVPPVALCLPLEAAEVTVAPDVVVHPWRAVQWISGAAKGPIGVSEPTKQDLARWAPATRALRAFQRLDEALTELVNARRDFAMSDRLYQLADAELPREVYRAVLDNKFPDGLSERDRDQWLFWFSRRHNYRHAAGVARNRCIDAEREVERAINEIALNGLAPINDITLPDDSAGDVSLMSYDDYLAMRNWNPTEEELKALYGDEGADS